MDKKNKKNIEIEENEELDEVLNEEDTDTELEDDSDKKTDEESKEKLEEINNKYLRLQADFINYKKRNEKEKESIYSYAKSTVISDFLTVLDNFERAFDSSEDDDKGSSFYNGMEMVHKQLVEALKKNGMEEIEALNSKFDPNYHYAVMQEESEKHDSDTVIEVMQKGYKIKDKVIRPSMVKVSK